MSGKTDKVVVKVKSNSEIVLSHCMPYRAINAEEFKRLVVDSDDCKLAIIENIKDSEYDNMKETIEKAASNGVTIMFYVPSNEEITCGLADELNYPIYLNEVDLFMGIYKKTGMDISVNTEVRGKINSDIEESGPFDSDGLFDTDSSYEEPEENVVPTEEYIENIQKLKDANESNHELLKLLEDANRRIDELNEANSTLEKERKLIDEQYNKFMSNTKVVINPVSYEEYSALQSELSKYKDIEAVNTELNNKLEKLSVELKDREDKISGLEAGLEYEKENNSKALELQEKLSLTLSELDDVRREYDKLKADNEASIEDIKNEAEIKLKDIEVIRGIQEDKINMLTGENDKLHDEIGSLLSEIDVLKESEKENKQLKDELEKQQAQRKELKDKYDKLLSLAGTNEDGIATLSQNNNYLTTLNNSLVDKNNELTGKCNRLTEMNNTLEGNLKKAIENIGVYKSRIEALKVNAGTDDISVQKISYTGKAKVISVLGRGSYGITTTAISIASELADKGNRVVAVDLDMMAANFDSFFSVKPYNGDKKVSAVGALINNGITDALGNNLLISRGSNLMLATGFYSKKDSIKIASADFSTFFSKLGDNFDYIVVDLGKIGSSGIVDSLIKNVCSISFRVITVTIRGKINISKLKNKLTAFSIEPEKMVWLCNLSSDGALGIDEVELLKGYKSTVIPIDADFFGKRKNFSWSHLIKGSFIRLMEHITI